MVLIEMYSISQVSQLGLLSATDESVPGPYSQQLLTHVEMSGNLN